MQALATFGGGCFWCTEAIFTEVAGVIDVSSGYSGGHVERPTYEQVCSGTTGHAEVVQITFDPEVVNYADLVRLHLSSHDPTTLNRQGADHGTQYRSVIFTHDEAQATDAKRVIADMQAMFASPIVTDVQPFMAFYRAEAYHQDYYARNPDAGYCRMVIAPKLNKFRMAFMDKLQTR
jgi:methionine-S-sulfoxide reductase